ncbi:MAG: NAD(P)-dependent dehydrogenase (short-subunit alcohol dehydrogenase family) [Paracoccaceae bacterium]|jgi:NAD(P)-dependent dehydrogenase (short-subunit alcohol dehydrogenase family)
MTRFKGRTALITAAGSGVGLGAALRLAAEGAAVTIWDRDKTALAGAVEQAAAAGVILTVVALDMTDGAAVDDAVARFVAENRRIDVLVNNIGGSLHTPFRFLEQSDQDWGCVMSVNVTACVRTTRNVLPHMIAQDYGRVINMGSKAGRFGSLFAGANYTCAFRRIRPPIPTAFAHSYRTIRPPVTRCVEAQGLGISCFVFRHLF